MKRILAFIIMILMISSVCYAGTYENRPSDLEHIDLFFDMPTMKILVGTGMRGGHRLVLPSRNKEMLVTLKWVTGGYVDVLFIDNNGKICWDSYNDINWSTKYSDLPSDTFPSNDDLYFVRFSLHLAKGPTHDYGVSQFQTKYTYVIGTNVKEIIVYCSENDSRCEKKSGWEIGIEVGGSKDGLSGGVNAGYSSSKTCSPEDFEAAVEISNVRLR